MSNKRKREEPEDGPKKCEKFSKDQKRFRLMLLHHDTGLIAKKLEEKFNYLYSPNTVSLSYVRRNITADLYQQWLDHDNWGKRKSGTGNKNKITMDMESMIEDWIEDDDILMKDIPDKIKAEFGVTLTERTVTNHFKKKPGNANGYTSHVTPLATPLSEDDMEARRFYAEHGPINNWTFEEFDDICEYISLPKSWKERKKLIAFWDHKPFYLGKFHRHNARQCRFNRTPQKAKKITEKKETKALDSGKKRKICP